MKNDKLLKATVVAIASGLAVKALHLLRKRKENEETVVIDHE